jgi:hypothetical protein
MTLRRDKSRDFGGNCAPHVMGACAGCMHSQKTKKSPQARAFELSSELLAKLVVVVSGGARRRFISCHSGIRKFQIEIYHSAARHSGKSLPMSQ